MTNFLIGATIVFVAINLVYFFKNKTYEKSYFSSALLLKLVIVMSAVLFGFAIIYYLLSLNDVILVESLSKRKPIDPTFLNLLYFSGETLVSVGYGDMIPVRSARFFAIIESFLGILLPSAYFMKSLDLANQSKRNG
ncbi:potassium channel family protein [Halobacillus yeomjeoni]|uniref:potassium channel family protein n=1 Tax=Halobacillus yeomjeoni TaxID=311194 RepID=UPI001CD45377|nr:potassium channel family protein [Halobacillus yeomjeoni]MCA0983712.1 potassium channel family protein [Halobacillus yeomjeoni]